MRTMFSNILRPKKFPSGTHLSFWDPTTILVPKKNLESVRINGQILKIITNREVNLPVVAENDELSQSKSCHHFPGSSNLPWIATASRSGSRYPRLVKPPTVVLDVVVAVDDDAS